MTGLDLVSACMRLVGALASGETPDSSEANDGLSSINRMIDSWSNEGLMIYAITEETPITLVGGQASYTLGLGGNLTNRPQEIERAIIRDNSIDYPVDIRSVDEYAEILNKSIQSNHPYQLYDDAGYPQRTIKLYPVPSTANSLILWTKRALTTIATLTTSLSLPPGYERALVFNGAVELAPEYGKQPSEAVIGIAIGAKADIKRINSKPQYLECESAVVRPGPWNIMTGDYTR